MREEASAPELFERMMRTRVAPALRSHGVTGSFRTFKFRDGNYEGVIHSISSKWNTRSKAEFTFELGARYIPYGDFRSGGGFWSRRIGRLLPGGSDKWWGIIAGAKDDYEVAAAEVTTSLVDFGLLALRVAFDWPRYPPDPQAIWSRPTPAPPFDLQLPERGGTQAGLPNSLESLRLLSDDELVYFSKASFFESGTDSGMGVLRTLFERESVHTLVKLEQASNRLEHDLEPLLREDVIALLEDDSLNGRCDEILHATAERDEDYNVRWRARYALALRARTNNA
jgi:hypothetical protein